jgi:hypothetical protein
MSEGLWVSKKGLAVGSANPLLDLVEPTGIGMS